MNEQQGTVISQPGCEELIDEYLRFDALSYDDLIAHMQKLDDLMQPLMEQNAADKTKIQLVQGMLVGAKELILRQDETKQDFTIAVLILLEQIESQLPDNL